MARSPLPLSKASKVRALWIGGGERLVTGQQDTAPDTLMWASLTWLERRRGERTRTRETASP